MPQLRVVLDHLPQCTPPSDAAGLAAYNANLRELGKRPQVYVKLSEIFRRIDGKVIEDPAFYRARLDELYGIFGEDRVLFGSDWPNSDQWAPYPKVLGAGAGVFQRQESRGAGEVFLEEFGGGLPLGQTRKRTAAGGLMRVYDAN